MRVVLQRVASAEVRVGDETVARIGPGLLVLVGIEGGDGSEDVAIAVDKIIGLRIFPDEIGKMNLSIGEIGGAILVVSQFTLVGDVRRGRRPSFGAAADPSLAAHLIEEMVVGFRRVGIATGSGMFGASMQVELVNDGPVTLVFDVRHARLG